MPHHRSNKKLPKDSQKDQRKAKKLLKSLLDILVLISREDSVLNNKQSVKLHKAMVSTLESK